MNIILILIFLVSLLLSSKVLPYIYIDFMENKLIKAKSELQSGKNIEDIEGKFNVTIVKTMYQDKTIDDFNEEVKRNFDIKKISLNKFWIVEEQLQKIKDGNSISIVYSQDKQKSSFYTHWIEKDDFIYVIGISVVFFSEIGSFFIYYLISILLVILLIISIAIKFQSLKIVSPILLIKKKAEQISNREYVSVGTYPNNEIGELAKSIDFMSNKLKENEKRLVASNHQIKELSANLAHELKTPISIIEAYAQGIRDGLDDDSFLDEILEQTRQLNIIVSDMVRLVSLQDDSIKNTPVDIIKILEEQIENKSRILNTQNRNIVWERKEHSSRMLEANELLINLLFSNVLNNAIKYGNESNIIVKDYNEGSFWILEVINETNIQSEDIENLWAPFTVGNNLSSTGTGLGLAIVKEITKKYGIESILYIENNYFMIRFIFDI